MVRGVGQDRLDDLKRGDLVTVSLPGDQGKPRPALVIQADLFDRLSSVTLLPLTGTLVDVPLLRVAVEPSAANGLTKLSHVMVDQPQTSSRGRVGAVIGPSRGTRLCSPSTARCSRFSAWPDVTASAAFLLAFPALLSIVNPLGMAFIVEDLLRDLPRADRARVVRRVGLYSLSVMLGALWFGAAVLSFFGVSIEALRLGGGLVVVLSSLELLLRPEVKEARKQDQANDTDRPAPDRAFFPITMPMTTGPGTISVAIALGAERPDAWEPRLVFYAGVSAAALALAALIWFTYWSADWMARLLSPSTQRIISRLAAFLLLCIGVQIMISGATGVAAMIQAHLRGRQQQSEDRSEGYLERRRHRRERGHRHR